MIELSKQEIELLIEAIENLDVYVSDDDNFEMLENSSDDFKENLENLYNKLKGDLS